MIKKKQQVWILELYKKYGDIISIQRITGFNYRTIKKYLVMYGVDTTPEVKSREITIYVPEVGNIEFKSIAAACRYLNSRDIEKQKLLLGKNETFEEGLQYRVLKKTSYRRYINYALRGELKQKFDWRVLNGKEKKD